MYSGKIAPWDQYPKNLRFNEIMDPLEVVKEFFSWGWPADHRDNLKMWRNYVINRKAFKDRYGSSNILYIYDGNIRLIEVMYILLLKNKEKKSRLEDILDEQIAGEREQWIYFPKNLSKKQLADPYKAIDKFFKYLSPQDYRSHLHDWLSTALSKSAADEVLSATQIISVYRNIRKLYSAAWLIYKREAAEIISSRISDSVESEIDSLNPIFNPR